MFRRLRLLFAAALCILFGATYAKAATITDLVSYTVSGAITASGSYLLTFDPTVSYHNQTAGLTVLSFSDSFASASTVIPAGFDYTPGQTLIIGGTNDEVSAVDARVTDYYIVIDNPLSNPVFDYFVGSDATAVVNYVDYTGTVSITPYSTAITPEPSGIILLGTGLLGALAAFRTRPVRDGLM